MQKKQRWMRVLVACWLLLALSCVAQGQSQTPNYNKAKGGIGVNLAPNDGGPTLGYGADWRNIWLRFGDAQTGLPNIKKQVDAAVSLGATCVRFVLSRPAMASGMTTATWLAECRQAFAYIAAKGLYLHLDVSMVDMAVDRAQYATGNLNLGLDGVADTYLYAGLDDAVALIKVAASQGNLMEIISCENEYISPASTYTNSANQVVLKPELFAPMAKIYAYMKAQFGNRYLFGWSSNGSSLSIHPWLQMFYPWLVAGASGVIASDPVIIPHIYFTVPGANICSDYRGTLSTFGQSHVPPADVNLPILITESGPNPPGVVNPANGQTYINVELQLTAQQRHDNMVGLITTAQNGNALLMLWTMYRQSLEPNATYREDWGLVNSDWTPRTGAYEVFQAYAASRQSARFIPKITSSPRRRRH